MRGAEGIVFAFVALRETREPARLAQRADAVSASGDDLMRVGLMADVPDQAVARRVEHPVQRHGQFYDAEPGAEMPARHRNGIDRFPAQFVRHLLQLAFRQGAQVFGRLDRVEKRRLAQGFHLGGSSDHDSYGIGRSRCKGPMHAHPGLSPP